MSDALVDLAFRTWLHRLDCAAKTMLRCRIALLAALTACKASPPVEAKEAGGTPHAAAVDAGTTAEEPSPTAGPPPESDSPRTTGALSAKGSPARPLSSSLSELETAPVPEIEGEPTIAVFVERVSGGLMPDIEHATSRLRAGMRACYLRYLGEDPSDASRLSLRIVVSTNGSVRSARPDGATDIDASAVDCMVRRAVNATFPPPTGEPAEIVLSIAFLPPHHR